ncbi:26S proteasome regulatory subunit 4 homolog A, partial [Tanacetum coccineum]
MKPGVITERCYGCGRCFPAVANSTSATFLRVVSSELIQKYLGDGPKLVRELFRVADDLSPSIVFIDEIDASWYKEVRSMAHESFNLCCDLRSNHISYAQ